MRPLLDAGELPYLAKLVSEGTRAVLRSSIQPSSEQAWPTMTTGLNCGGHGLYGYMRRRPGSYVHDYVNARFLRAPQLWDWLGNWDRQVIVVNVPMTYPPHPVNGVLITGFMAPGTHSTFTYPADLPAELRERVGDYIINVDIERGALDRDEGNLADLVARFRWMTERRTAAVEHLARTRPWDFLMVVYVSLDRLGHKFWRYSDPSHPLYTPAGAARWGAVLPDTYRQLDEQVGRLLQLVTDQDTVLVVSDHGFGPLTHAVYLNRWLESRGFLAQKLPERRTLADRARGAVTATLRRAVQGARHPWITGVKQQLFARFPALRGQLHSAMAYAQLDWSRTQVYAVGTMGNFYVNLQGREPEGIVAPGAEYEAVRDRLISDLRSLRDPDSGRPIFEGVWRREELYHGPYLDEAPDVIGLMDPHYHGAVVDWRSHGETIVEPLGDELLFLADLSGQHTMDGIFIARGPGIRRGVEVPTQQIADVAATTLYRLGHPIPSYLDGRVMTDILEPEWLSAHPVQTVEVAHPGQAEPPAMPGGYSAADEELITERLSGLGYL
jgi:predicted AlkP superfamily phosphohydrolase/phosphomutase